MISGGRKAGSRRERSRESLVAKLTLAVEGLLAEGDTYTDLSLDDILERAKVPRSTFYYNLRDKGELLVAVSADAMNDIVEASNALYEDGRHRSREEFRSAVRKTAEAWIPHVPLMNAVAEVAAYNPEVKEQFLAVWRVAQQRVAQHIREGQQAGFVRPDLHPEHTASWLTFMAERGISLLVSPASDQHARDLMDALATTVWHTLYPDT